jgi:hypothetical protein
MLLVNVDAERGKVGTGEREVKEVEEVEEVNEVKKKTFRVVPW